MKYIVLFFSVISFSAVSQYHGGGSVFLDDVLSSTIARESLRHKMQTRKLSNSRSFYDTNTIRTPLGTSIFKQGNVVGCGKIQIGGAASRTFKKETIVVDGSITNFSSGRGCRD